MLRYCQLIVKEVLDTSEPIYTVNKAKILEDWTTALPLRKQTLPEPQVPYIHLLNPGQLTRHPTLSHLPYIYATACVTAKGVTAKTETRAIKTSPPQRPTLHLSPAHTIQGHHLISAPQGRPSRASLAITLENQTHPKLDDIKYTYAVNFTQF